MLRTKINGETVKHHLRYSCWIYLVLFMLVCCGWSMMYNATAYVPPEEKTIEVTIVGDYVPESTLEYLEEQSYGFLPEMEKISYTNIVLDLTGEEGDYSGYQKLQVVIAVGEGDIYLLTREQMKSYAEYGAFLSLDDALSEDGVLHGLFTEEEIAQGTFSVEEYEDDAPHCFGLPLTRMKGLTSQGINTDDLYMCLMTMSYNQDNSLKLMSWMANQTESTNPSWLEPTENTEEENVEKAENQALPEIG